MSRPPTEDPFIPLLKMIGQIDAFSDPPDIETFKEERVSIYTDPHLKSLLEKGGPGYQRRISNILFRYITLKSKAFEALNLPDCRVEEMNDIDRSMFIRNLMVWAEIEHLAEFVTIKGSPFFVENKEKITITTRDIVVEDFKGKWSLKGPFSRKMHNVLFAHFIGKMLLKMDMHNSPDKKQVSSFLLGDKEFGDELEEEQYVFDFDYPALGKLLKKIMVGFGFNLPPSIDSWTITSSFYEKKGQSWTKIKCRHCRNLVFNHLMNVVHDPTSCWKNKDGTKDTSLIYSHSTCGICDSPIVQEDGLLRIYHDPVTCLDNITLKVHPVDITEGELWCRELLGYMIYRRGQLKNAEDLPGAKHFAELTEINKKLTSKQELSKAELDKVRLYQEKILTYQFTPWY